jgi:broad-specificity NMP kinase
MLLVCLYGAPGVGKLSVGSLLQETADYLLLHDHLTIETAAALFPFGSEGFKRLRSELFRTLLEATCATGRGIVATHADDIFWEPRFASILHAGLGTHRYSLKQVFLRCSEAEHERRIADRGRSHYRKIQSLDRLQTLVDAGEFEPTRPRDEDLVLDTSEMSAWETARHIQLWLAPSLKAQVA